MEKEKNKQSKGLKKLRANIQDKEPTHYCENCKCKRYSPCYCEKKGQKNG
jgi:hypothetical protein